MKNLGLKNYILIICAFLLSSYIVSNKDSDSVPNKKQNILNIGDEHQGGIIFYLDDKGGGLIATPRNQSVGANYGKAEDICINLNVGGYYDWYLPSKDELNLMFYNQDIIDGFSPETYWSSTEYGSSVAWTQSFISGAQNFDGKDSPHYVRAIRAF